MKNAIPTALLLLMFCCDISFALDTVYLKSGRVLHGEVREGEEEKGGAYIQLITETGAVYKLDKGDIVKRILKRGKAEKDYEARLRHISDTATQHHELAKWCEKQDRGKTRFKEQIRWHYENVLRLDPEHANVRKKLGYMKLANGTWVAQAQFKSRQGYLKDRRHWSAQLVGEVEANDERIDAELGAKKKELNKWVANARRGKVQPAVLAGICDASTLSMVYENALSAQFNVELCRVYLDAIASVRHPEAIKALAHFAIEATHREIREHAIALLSQAEMDHVKAVLYLKDGLRFSEQWHVQNAAFAIAEVASSDNNSREHAIVPLANALVTEHEVRIEGALEPGRMNPTFGPGGTGLNMGGGPQTRKQRFRNSASLDALRRLFEVDFQYDEQAWKDWYIQNYTLSDIAVRGDG